MHTLKATGLGHRFGQRVLFRRMTLKVHGGEVLAVTGANGVGKSTLLKILAGVLRPTTGHVSLQVNGHIEVPETHPLQVGFVAPYMNVYEDLTGWENLQFIAQARGLPLPEVRIQKALQAVGLAARAQERVRTFSSGMKQRMKIAAATLTNPPVLILDEPTVNMDAQGQALCADVVADAKVRGCIVVIASNVPADYQGADHVVAIEDYGPKGQGGGFDTVPPEPLL